MERQLNIDKCRHCLYRPVVLGVVYEIAHAGLKLLVPLEDVKPRINKRLVSRGLVLVVQTPKKTTRKARVE